MQVEEWREVPGFPGYQASNWGRVRSNRGVLKLKLWRHGRSCYRVFNPRRNGHTHSLRAHVAVCSAFNGERPSGAVTRHLDGDSLNNCADNLAWGTHQENHADMRVHRRHHNSLKTHCPRCSTAYPEATFTLGEVRRCAPCRREQQRRANARVRAKRREDTSAYA